MTTRSDHPREFTVKEYSDYGRFWQYHERRQLAFDIARSLRDGVSVALNVSPGDMTEYRMTLIPSREHVQAHATYIYPSEIEEESHSVHCVAVFLHNCGQGSHIVHLLGAQSPVNHEQLYNIATDRDPLVAKATRSAVAASLEAIRLADAEVRTRGK